MKLRLPIGVFMLFLLILILPFFVSKVGSGTSTNTLYAHAETTTIGGVNYYLHKLSSADGPATTLSASAATTGRKLMGRWVYPLNGIVSIPASTWTVTYRAMRSASATSVVAHCDVDILIRKSDNTIRTTIATNVANSPSLTLVNAWETLTGTYNWPGYTVVDQTDYLEVAYYIEVTTPQSSKSVRLLVDDPTLPLADQTKIENVIFTYPNQAPVASFTYSPTDPTIYETITFNASSSYDPDGSIVSYTWDFGDGYVTTVTDPIITHVYTTAASTVNYTVTLTVTDNEGLTGSATAIVPVTNPAILQVSLPDGTYVGSNSDKWLEECWLLNITGNSGTFTLRINNTSGKLTSYDTHLIVALNNAGYDNLVSLTVNGVSIIKDDFKNGEPKPYSLNTWPSGDVYPTWFNDTLVNVGTIPPKGYVDVTISVTFSNATGARMHFDAYGSKNPVPPPPSEKGEVTHNPLSEDSTVIFSPIPPPPTAEVTFTQIGIDTDFTGTVLTVDNINYSVADLPKTFTWEVGSNHTFEYHSPLIVVVNGKQYLWTYTTGLSTERSGTITVPSGGGTVTGHYKTQFYLTVVSPHGTPGGEGWYDKDSTAYATVTPLTVPGPAGVRYVFTHWSGDATGNTSPSDPITMDAPKTAIANWKTEYQLTVRTSGLNTYTTNVYNDTTPLGTAADATPYIGWFEEGSLILLDIDSPIVDGSKRFVFTNWSGDATGTNRPVNVIMNSAKDITANYKTQYQITVTASPSGAIGGTFKVTYIQCGTTYVNVEKTTPWTEWVDADTAVTVSEPQDIVNGYKFDSYNPSATVTMDQAKTITLVYKAIPPLSVSISPPSAKIKVGESVTFTSTVSGGQPPYQYQWYLNGSAVSGATSSSWTFTPTSSGYYIVRLKVTDSLSNIANSNEATVTVAPPLTVSISPTSASILVGQSITFTSTVSGGYPPYTYQWYLNGAPVSGATSSSWTFTPTAAGIYYVYLKITDASGNTAQSETARITVTAVPVGGYSVALTRNAPITPTIAYAMLMALFASLLSLTKRNRK